MPLGGKKVLQTRNVSHPTRANSCVLSFSAMFRFLLPCALIVTSGFRQDKPPDTAQAPSSPTQAVPSQPTGQPSNPASPPDTAQSGLHIRKSVAPTYPSEAREKGIQGRVVLRVLVTENGTWRAQRF